MTVAIENRSNASNHGSLSFRFNKQENFELINVCIVDWYGWYDSGKSDTHSKNHFVLFQKDIHKKIANH